MSRTGDKTTVLECWWGYCDSTKALECWEHVTMEKFQNVGFAIVTTQRFFSVVSRDSGTVLECWCRYCDNIKLLEGS